MSGAMSCSKKNAGKSGVLSNRISLTLSRLLQGGEKALITFVTAGDPDLESTAKLVLTLEKAGADIVELGVPYSDPLADGPTIQMASQRALRSGTSLQGIFRTVKELRRLTQIPIVLMTYYNPLLRYGLVNVADDAAGCGVDGFIVPDLPMEEAQPFHELLSAKGVCLVPLVAPTSGADRIRMISSSGEGFIYCVSLTGVTGVREGMPEGLKEFMQTVRQSTDKPLGVGFGISTPAQAAAVSQYCDAVIVGSALVKTIGEKGNTPELYDSVHRMVEELKKPLRNSNPGGKVSVSGGK